MEKLNLFQKIQAVANDIKNIEKNMTVGSGSYSYKAVSDLDVTLQVKDAETRHKLLSIPFGQELIKSEVIKTIEKDNKEKITYVDNIKMTIRIIDLENTDSFIDIVSFGKGIDSADKGFGKASTYARKYGLLNAYKIATGEDPDAEKSKETHTLSVNERKTVVVDYLMKENTKRNEVLSHFVLGSVDDLNTEQIDIIYKQFKSKKLI